MKVVTGKKNVGWKVVIYGPEGVGKTKLASKFPDSVFIDTEGSTSRYEDITRIEPDEEAGEVLSWKFITAAVMDVLKGNVSCKTLVIDTADWTETLCSNHVCKTNNKKGIEDFGFGKGYVYLSETYQTLLTALDALAKKGINVVFTAHAKMVKIELPEQDGSYDRWQFKLSKQVAPILKEWADMILFCNYETVVVVDDKTKKAKGKGEDKRVMYTTHHSCWDAKNRSDLPSKLDLDYSEIGYLFESTPATKKKTTTKKAEPKVEDVPVEESVPVEEPAIEEDFIGMNPPVEEPEFVNLANEVEDLFAVDEPATDSPYPENLSDVVKELFQKCEDANVKSTATNIIKKCGSYSKCDEKALQNLYDLLK